MARAKDFLTEPHLSSSTTVLQETNKDCIFHQQKGKMWGWEGFVSGE